MWGSGYSGVGFCLDGVRSCIGHCSTQSTSYAFRQVVSIAVFDDSTDLILCWGLGESLEGVLGLLTVSFHQSILYVLALLFNPLFLCCLHLLPDSCLSYRLWSHGSRN